MIHTYKVIQHEVKAVRWTGKNFRQIQRFTNWIVSRHGLVLYLQLPHANEYCLTGSWVVKLEASIAVLGPDEFKAKYKKA